MYCSSLLTIQSFLGQTNINHSSVLISVDSVPELWTITSTDNGLVLAAAVTVAELKAKLKEITADSIE